MVADIYVSTGEMSSRLLQDQNDLVDKAYQNLSKIGQYPTYCSQTGTLGLYSSSVLTEIASIKNKLYTISDNLAGLGKILNTGPEDLAAVDAACKSELTTWLERVDYSVDRVFTQIKTGAESIINYWVDDYKNKGLSYKIIQSVKAVGKAAPAIIGCAASWVAAPWAPTTWLSSAYAVNAGVSMWSDLDNIWSGNYDKVGQVNILKDTLVNSGGELSKMLGGSEKVGQIIGNCVYGLGEITTTVSNGMRMNDLKNITNTTDAMKQVGGKVKTAMGVGEGSVLDLKSQVIQSDFSFQTVKDAVKETPDAIKGLWDIATNSSLSEVAKDYKLLTYTMPNIMETASTVKLLSDVGTKTADLTNKGIELIKILKD